MAITLLTLTPMRAEVRLSWAEARIARPTRVRRTNMVSRSMTTTVTPTTKSWKCVIWTPPSENDLGSPAAVENSGMVGNAICCDPKIA